MIGPIVLAAMLGLSGPTSAQGTPTQRAPFSFRDYVVGDMEVQHKDSLQWCEKSNILFVDRHCFVRFKNLGVVAGQVVIFGDIGFSADRLSTIKFLLNTSSFEPVIEAFRTKWGDPCAISSPIVHNGLGASFTDDTSTWCFPDGKITVTRYDDKVTQMRIYFRISSIAGSEELAPPVDF